jgi:hypothetical protein
MAKEKSKEEILRRLQNEREKLEQTLMTLSPQTINTKQVVGEWTIKDVLAHLADWEEHMLIWMQAGRSGDPVEHPDPGLTWKELKKFNQRVYERHCIQSLEEVMAYFHNVHKRFMTMVSDMPDEELFTPGKYSFLGKDTVYGWLGQYASHDRWGRTYIAKK